MFMIKAHTKRDLPWKLRLPKKPVIDHPDSLDAFRALGRVDRVAQLHLNYLEWCSKLLYKIWIPCWDEMLAVGPFTGRKRKHTIIPIIIVYRYRAPYTHVVALTEALSKPYLEFGILPVIYLLSKQERLLLEKSKAPQWEMTKRVSIHLRKNK